MHTDLNWATATFKGTHLTNTLHTLSTLTYLVIFMDSMFTTSYSFASSVLSPMKKIASKAEKYANQHSYDELEEEEEVDEDKEQAEEELHARLNRERPIHGLFDIQMQHSANNLAKQKLKLAEHKFSRPYSDPYHHSTNDETHLSSPNKNHHHLHATQGPWQPVSFIALNASTHLKISTHHTRPDAPPLRRLPRYVPGSEDAQAAAAASKKQDAQNQTQEHVDTREDKDLEVRKLHTTVRARADALQDTLKDKQSLLQISSNSSQGRVEGSSFLQTSMEV